MRHLSEIEACMCARCPAFALGAGPEQHVLGQLEHSALSSALSRGFLPTQMRVHQARGVLEVGFQALEGGLQIPGFAGRN